MLEHNQLISEGLLLAKTYSSPEVMLSVVIAIISSFTTFGIAGRVIAACNNVQKTLWFIFGSFTMGLGIWAMHFIGMLALHLAIPVNYDVSITALSALPAVVASAVIIWLTTRQQKTSKVSLILGGIIIGIGVGLMHFSGMMAMQMNAVMTHELLLTLVLSLLAVVLIIIALSKIDDAVRNKGNDFICREKVIGAVLMGGATSMMHYSAMAETNFFQINTAPILAGVGHDVLTIMVTVVIGSLLIVALLLPLYLYNKQIFRLLSRESMDDKARIRAFIDSTPDALIQINAAGRIISWKGRSEQIFGWQESEMLGQSLHRIIPLRYRDSHDNGLQLFRKIEKIALLDKTIEIEARHKDGHEFPIEITVVSVEMSDGHFEFSAFIRDISVRKDAALELLKQQAITDFQKKALDEHAIVSIADIKGNISYVNEKFEQISQFSTDEVIGDNHRILKSDYHPESFFKEMWRTISAGNVWHGEIKNKAKDGSFYWVESTILPMINEQGKPEQYVAIRTDITAIKELEVKQHEINAQLVDAISRLDDEKENANKANKAKSEFLSSMSHELRTPLNAILGFAQLLEMDTETPLTEDQEESIHHILSSGKHLLSLINDVLELSAIEAGKTVLSMEAVNLKDIVAETVVLLDPLVGSMTLRVASDLEVIVNADYTKLKQVLINLVSNAIKYNRENGSVTIDWRVTAENTIRISIIDTGIGISKANKHQIFGAFNRLGQELSEIEGTGIGLVVTKNLVEIMGGNIGFDSVEGEGSTFWIELATAIIEKEELVDMPEQEHLEVDAVISISSGVSHKQVLYVEDNPTNIKLMQSIFNKQDSCDLSIAETGELGWELALNKQFDLILMDINLPGMSGIKLTQKLRQTDEYKNTPILAVSASAMEHELELAEGIFEAYITKPIKIDSIFSALKNYLS